MWEWFSQINALTVFLALAAIGFLFVLISLLFGEIFGHFDFGHDADLDHSADFDHDVDHDVSHEIGDGGPSFFSLRVITVFITAFGGFGAIGIKLGFGTLLSSLFGLVGGVALGALVYFFASFLYKQQATSMIASSDLVGMTAHVIVGIPAGGIGQIRCVVGESMVEKIARSRDETEIPYNSTVRIEEIAGESVIVSPCSAEDEGRGRFLFTSER
ncbi:MAG: NfeD family protein [Blastocatellia bacterium]|nr:NfeD family protein [Blastocatellia bacterium]